MNRNNLIKIIHVAKRNLSLSDENYQVLLEGATGKSSCKLMNMDELKAAYRALTAIGFRKQRGNGGKAVVTQQERRPAPRVSTGEKIIAVWVTMGNHGLLSDTSRGALDAYVARMTKHHNGGVGVASIAWLDGVLASRVLEALKRWHMRMMGDALRQKGIVPLSGYEALKAQFEAR